MSFLLDIMPLKLFILSHELLTGRKLPISNVVFVNGALDPWKPASVTQDLSPGATAIYIEGELL